MMHFRAVSSRFCLAAVLLITCGCVSIGNPFLRMKPDYSDLPVDAVRQIAAEIEAQVKQGNREPKLTPREGIDPNTPEILQAIRTRAARAELCSGFLSSGHAIENRNGLIAVVHSKAYGEATTRRERDRDALLVMGENNNRWTIYEGIIEAGNFSPKNLSAVQAIFHEARTELLEAGQRYENPDGTEAVK